MLECSFGVCVKKKAQDAWAKHYNKVGFCFFLIDETFACLIVVFIPSRRHGNSFCVVRNSKIGHDGSKNRSLGQIVGKPSVRSRGHIFSPIIMKLGQIICFDKMSEHFENGSCRVKN